MEKNNTDILINNFGNVFISGTHGTGKTTLIINALIEKMKKKEGCLCIDTEGTISKIFLENINKKKIDDICYLDFSNEEYIHGLNMLKTTNPEKAAENFVQFLNDLFGSTLGLIQQNYIYHAIHSLIDSDDKNIATLGYISRMFISPGFRTSVIKSGDEKMYSRWNRVYAPMGEDLAVNNYIDGLLSVFVEGQVGRIVSSPEVVSIEDMIAEGKIVVVHIPTTKLGDMQSMILSAMVMYKINNYFCDHPKKGEKTPYTIFLDQGQLLPHKIMERLFITSQKSNAQILFTHTSTESLVDQFKKNYFIPYIKNCDTIIMYKQHVVDAMEYVEKIYNNLLTKESLITLKDKEFLIYSSQTHTIKKGKSPFYNFIPKNTKEKINIIQKIYALKFGTSRKIIDQDMIFMQYT